MKLGIQTNGWAEDLHVENLATIAAEIKQAGYEGFEVGFKRVHGRYPALVLAQIAAEAGLEIVGIHDGAQFNSAEWWQFGESRCQQVAAYAAKAGAPFMMLSGQPSPQRPTDLALRADKLNRLGEIAQVEGVRLCFHNHDWEFFHGAAEMDYLVAHTEPQLVSLLLDIGWVQRAVPNTAVTVQQLLSRTANYHLKDETEAGQWTEVGQGIVDWPVVFAAIRKNERDPWLIVEHDEPRDQALASAAESARFVRHHFSSASDS